MIVTELNEKETCKLLWYFRKLYIWSCPKSGVIIDELAVQNKERKDVFHVQ